MDNITSLEEKLRFKDLAEGDKYIAFPLPGDNSGHGGYKGTHYIFEKAKKDDVYVGVRMIDNNLSSAYDLMPVIKVE